MTGFKLHCALAREADNKEITQNNSNGFCINNVHFKSLSKMVDDCKKIDTLFWGNAACMLLFFANAVVGLPPAE